MRRQAEGGRSGRNILRTRATLCDMETVTHRQMRNQSAELLRRVEAGQSLVVTNNGRPVAVVSPVGRPVLDELVEQGLVRRAMRTLDSLRSIRRSRASINTAEILADVRGTW